MPQGKTSELEASSPHWLDPVSPLSSAVQYLYQYSDRFNWVGIYQLQNDCLKLGPYLGEETEHTEIPVGTGVCGAAVAQQRDLNVPDVRQLTNYLSCSAKTRSELVVLIRNRDGKIFGQIDIDSHTPDAFGAAEESTVRSVARVLGQNIN